MTLSQLELTPQDVHTNPATIGRGASLSTGNSFIAARESI
jgi:hypothetical protein